MSPPIAKAHHDARPPAWKVWSTAARPHTLTASISPCLVAFANTPQSTWNLRLAWLVFCFTVQIGTNLHNDYSDYVQGADTDKRVGQARATAKGWLTPTQTCCASVGVLSVTFLSGVYLLFETDQVENQFAWFLVVTSVFNAFAYTGGPFPLGYFGLGNFSIAYAGLGDVFVLLYFGLVAVLMIPYLLHCQGIPVHWPLHFSSATAVGMLATNIIIVNNLRDRHTDVLANKRTTAVRFGRMFSLMEYVTCNIVAYAIVCLQSYRLGSRVRLLPLLTVPLAFRETVSVFRTEGQALNKHVGAAAMVQFAFSILFSVACWIENAE